MIAPATEGKSLLASALPMMLFASLSVIVLLELLERLVTDIYCGYNDFKLLYTKSMYNHVLQFYIPELCDRGPL